MQMTSRRRIRLLAAVVASALIMLIAEPASASTSASASGLPLEYSLDGATWQSATIPLLSPAWRPVPGSVHTSTIYVRSTRDVPSNLGVFLERASSPSSSLLSAIEVAGADTSAVALDAIDRCTPLQSSRVSSSRGVPVSLTVRVHPALAADQLTALNIELAATMSDASVAPVPAGCPGGQSDGIAAGLATTGQDWRGLLPLAALGSAGIILGVILNRRRSEGGDA